MQQLCMDLVRNIAEARTHAAAGTARHPAVPRSSGGPCSKQLLLRRAKRLHEQHCVPPGPCECCAALHSGHSAASCSPHHQEQQDVACRAARGCRRGWRRPAAVRGPGGNFLAPLRCLWSLRDHDGQREEGARRCSGLEGSAAASPGDPLGNRLSGRGPGTALHPSGRLPRPAAPAWQRCPCCRRPGPCARIRAPADGLSVGPFGALDHEG
jgi:hypothetical protein